MSPQAILSNMMIKQYQNFTVSHISYTTHTPTLFPLFVHQSFRHVRSMVCICSSFRARSGLYRLLCPSVHYSNQLDICALSLLGALACPRQSMLEHPRRGVAASSVAEPSVLVFVADDHQPRHLTRQCSGFQENIVVFFFQFRVNPFLAFIYRSIYPSIYIYVSIAACINLSLHRSSSTYILIYLIIHLFSPSVCVL